jgi:hypothetical protein
MSTRPVRDRSPSLATRLCRTSPVRGAAFWAAALLPFVHVPLLLAGVQSAADLWLYLGLLAVNAVALVLGHDHRGGR